MSKLRIEITERGNAGLNMTWAARAIDVRREITAASPCEACSYTFGPMAPEECSEGCPRKGQSHAVW